jgi:hypothetical protein
MILILDKHLPRLQGFFEKNFEWEFCLGIAVYKKLAYKQKCYE